MLACLLLVAGALTFNLSAQTNNGAIVGVVTTANNVPVANAKIELENRETGVRMTAVTDNAGRYRFDNVPVGHYRIITTSGQTPAAPTQEFDVELNRDNTVNLTLPAGPATEAVSEVEIVPVRTMPAIIANTWNTRFTQYLPQPNFTTPAGGIFGAYNQSLTSEAVTSGGTSSRSPAVAGNAPISNNFHVDGMDNNNKTVPGPLVYVSNEATSQFSLFQNQQEPNFGHSMGGLFNTNVRTGSNGVHGQFYDYLQNRNLNAMEPAFKRMGFSDNPRYDVNRLGGSLGLPIVPSKVFLFGNFEYIPMGYTALPQGLTYAPTAAGFNQLANMRGISATNLGILQNAVGNNVGPAESNVTINGQSIPLGLVNNGVQTWRNSFMGTGAMDFTISPVDQVRLRYTHNDVRSNNAGTFLPEFLTPTNYVSLLASAAWYHSFGVRVNNELRFGYNRWDQSYPGGAFTLNGQPFPTIDIGGTGTMVLGPSQGFAQSSRFNTYHLADGINWFLGSHNVHLGFDGRRYIGANSGLSAFRGNYAYSGLDRFLLDLPADVTAERAFGTNYYQGNQFLLAGFLSDNWNVRSKVNLSLGLRYEYVTIPNDIAAQKFNAIANVPGLSFSEPRSQTRNFAPQVGLAISPTNMTVFRMGFGMAYDAIYNGVYLGPVSPVAGTMVRGNLLSNTPGFLTNGGVLNTLQPNQALTPAAVRSNVTSFYGQQKLPYNMQWNAGIEQAIYHKFTVELKYIGSRGVHIPMLTTFGALPRVTETQSLPVFFQQPTQAQLNSLTTTLNSLQGLPSSTFAQFGVNNPLMTFAPDGNSWYHAGVVALRHRWTGGFQMNANYTWSHTYQDTPSSPFELGFARGKNESVYDRRHRATITGLWDVAGLFHNTSNIARNVFANFTLSGTWLLESPQMLEPISNTDAGLFGFGASGVLANPNGQGVTGSGVSPLRNSSGQIVGYLAHNPNASFVSAAPGVFVNPIGGPRLELARTNNFDVSATKGFSVRDKFGFEIRADAYNLFNHAQLNASQLHSIDFTTLGTIPSYLIPSNQLFGGFGDVLSSHPRMLQLALRVTF